MTEQATIYLCMNEDGEYYVNTDVDCILSDSQETIGGEVFRIVKVTIAIERPVLQEVKVAVPDDAGNIVKVNVE